MTEYSIKCKNGWDLLAGKLYGHTVWSDKQEDERIYPGDETFIHRFNEKNASAYRYVVGVPPMPFSGNLLDAKVVILTLNPGYVEKVNKDRCLRMDERNKKQLSAQGRIITKGHKGMSQAITRGNIKDGGFDRLVGILKT